MALSKITNTGIGTVDDITLSGGVYLGGTASANYLDDYEEGTWTPVFADATSGGNASPTTAISAKYVKIGGLVHANCRFSDIDTTGLTGSNIAYLTGLPYVANYEAVGSIWFQALDVGTSLIMVTGRVFGAGSYIQFEQLRDALNDIALGVSNFLDDTVDISLTITYTTDT